MLVGLKLARSEEASKEGQKAKPADAACSLAPAPQLGDALLGCVACLPVAGQAPQCGCGCWPSPGQFFACVASQVPKRDERLSLGSRLSALGSWRFFYSKRRACMHGWLHHLSCPFVTLTITIHKPTHSLKQTEEEVVSHRNNQAGGIEMLLQQAAR